MEIDRSSTSVKNIVSGVANKLITLIMPFIIRTIILQTLSVQYVGLGSLFNSILEVLSLTELGFATALVFSMYRPIAEDNEPLVCALLRLYRNVYLVIGSIIAVVGIALMPFLQYIVKGTIPPEMNLYILYAVYLFNTVISYFLFGYKSSLLVAHNQNGTSTAIVSLCCVLQYGAQIVTLLVWKNYYAYVVLTPVFTILANLLRTWVVNKRFPQYKCVGSVDKATLATIKRNIGGLFFHRIGSVVVNSADNIVISVFFVYTGCPDSLTATGIYGNYYYIMSAVSGFLVVIYNSISAGVGNAVATKTREENYRDFKKFTFMNLWLVCWCTVCLFCLYQHFMGIWMHGNEQNMLPFFTMSLFCVYFYSYRARAIATQYQAAAGIFWEDRFSPVVEMLANVVLNVVLIRFIGFNGVLLSTILSMVCVATPWEIYIVFKLYFKRKPWEYLWHQLRYLLVTVALCAVTYAICRFLPTTGIGFLFVKLGICLIVPNALFLLVFCRTAEWKETLAFGKNFLAKRSKRRG